MLDRLCTVACYTGDARMSGIVWNVLVWMPQLSVKSPKYLFLKITVIVAVILCMTKPWCHFLSNLERNVSLSELLYLSFFLYLWPCGFQSFSVVFKHHVYWDIVAFLKCSVKLLVEGFYVSSFLIVKSGNLLHYNKLDTKNNNFESIHKLVTSVNDRHSYMFILDLIPFVWSTCEETSCQTLTFTSWKMNRDLERAPQVIRTSTGCFFSFLEMEAGDTHRSQHHFNLTISASVAFLQHNQLT